MTTLFNLRGSISLRLGDTSPYSHLLVSFLSKCSKFPSTGSTSTVPLLSSNSISLPKGPSLPCAISNIPYYFLGSSDNVIYRHLESYLLLWSDVNNVISFFSAKFSNSELHELGFIFYFSYHMYRIIFNNVSSVCWNKVWNLDIIHYSNWHSCAGFILLDGDKVIFSDSKDLHDYSSEWSRFSVVSFPYTTPNGTTTLTLKFAICDTYGILYDIPC